MASAAGAGASEVAARRGPVLCLGGALVDLVCRRHVRSLAEADAFVPSLGGTVANVAVAVARAGVPVCLLGGAGADAWGAWLRERLAAAGVDVSGFELVTGVQTPLALVAVDSSGEPSYTLYGDADATLGPAAERLEPALADAGALFISSNTLAGPDERELTMRARAVALETGRPVIFDPNLRLHRWRSQADAAASANACVPGALLVRCNAVEAEVMTGEADPERAALALLKAGARMVVITLGAEGAILRGELRADAGGVAAEVVSTMGAGDAFTGVLVARLALSDFYPPAVAASLREAVAAAARACERWGAVD